MAYGDRADDPYGDLVPFDPNPQPQADPFVDQLTALYAKYGQTLTPEDIAAHRGNPGGISAIENMLIAARAKPQTTVDTGAGNGSGGGGGFTGGSGLPSPFTSTFTPPAPVNLGGPAGIPYIPPTPTFTPPSYNAPAPFTYDKFTAPDPSQVTADPSYGFRLGQGLGAISNSEAAKGLWASGATGKAFNNYAQDFASQEYGNVYNRSLQNYITNANQAMNAYSLNAQYQNQMPYQAAFQNAQAAFAPQLLGYQTQAQAGQRQNELNYSNAYDKWLQDYNQKLGTGRFLFDVSQA